MKLSLITCRGGSGPGYYHVCRRPASLGPSVVTHAGKGARRGSLTLDLRGRVLPPRAHDLGLVYRLAGWATDVGVVGSLMQVTGVPVDVLSSVTDDLIALAEGALEGGVALDRVERRSPASPDRPGASRTCEGT